MESFLIDTEPGEANDLTAEAAAQPTASGHIGRWKLWLTFAAAILVGLLFQYHDAAHEWQT
jgi:hypothetical protein